MTTITCARCGRSLSPDDPIACPSCGHITSEAGDDVRSPVRPAPKPSSLLRGIFTIALVSVLAATLVPNFLRARGRGQHNACISNLSNIGHALEHYAKAHDGRLPLTLSELAPDYLSTVPTCPSAAADTYSGRYRGTEGGAYTVMCGGENHASTGTPENFPQFTSREGLRYR